MSLIWIPLLIYVVSPDTDVLLLLIYYYLQPCASTIYRTGSDNDQRDIKIRKMLVDFMENQNWNAFVYSLIVSEKNLMLSLLLNQLSQ